jgi:SAM-dependent methyltransferase
MSAGPTVMPGETPQLERSIAHSEKLGRAFGEGAAFWQDFYERDPGGPERLRAFRRALASVGATGRWLDAGCGIGMIAREFRASGLRVCGIDMAAGLLEEAKSVTGLPLVASGATPPAEDHLYRAPVERLPYEDGAFDGVYSSSVLEYVAELELALAELHRVVRAGGHLVFSLPNAFSVPRISQAVRGRRDSYFQLVPRWAYWSWEIKRMLKRTGWDPKQSSYFGATRRLGARFSERAWAASFVLVVAHKS